MSDAEYLRASRKAFGLTQAEMGAMLGYIGAQGQRQMCYQIEAGLSPLQPAARRLLDAYNDGHRPKDWPGEDK